MSDLFLLIVIEKDVCMKVSCWKAEQCSMHSIFLDFMLILVDRI